MKFVDRRLSAITLSTFAIFLAVGIAPAGTSQTAQGDKPACPMIRITCPTDIRANNELKMSVELKGGDSKVSPTYNWTVSAGTIVGGQGTPSIVIDTTGLENLTVTATIEAGGYDRACGYGSTVASCSTSVTSRPEARKFDEFGVLKPKEEQDKVDGFAIELQNDPAVQGYILSYNTAASRPGDAQKMATRIRDLLVTKRGIESSRLVTVTGGSRPQPTVELWIVPRGAQAPKPTSSAK